MNDQSPAIFATGIAVMMIGMYVIPTIIAWTRGHRQAPAITIVNIFLGWTFIGWWVAMIWALIRPSAPVIYVEAKGNRASMGFDDDHSIGARRAGRDGRSISHSYGAEGRNWID